MPDELDPESICRDENCDRDDIHERHDVATSIPRSPRVRRRLRPDIHHRPRRPALWEQPDPVGLAEAVERAAVGMLPKTFAEVANEVTNDYGSTTLRSIHRHLIRLIEACVVVKLDLGVKYAAYIAPTSRLLGDLDNLRDHVLGKREIGPAVAKRIA